MTKYALQNELSGYSRADGSDRGFRIRKHPRNRAAIPAFFPPGELAIAFRRHTRSSLVGFWEPAIKTLICFFIVVTLFASSVLAQQPPAESKSPVAQADLDSTEADSHEREKQSISPVATDNAAISEKDETGSPPTANANSDSIARRDSTDSFSGVSVQAKKHFLHGLALIEEKNYNSALAEFERARALDREHLIQCDIIYNVAICYQEMFRYESALRFYKNYEELCQQDAESDPGFAKRLRALQAKLATFDIGVNVAAEVWVDDARRGRAPSRIVLSAGRHTIELRARGYESAKREIQIASGGSRKLSIKLKAISEFHGLSPAYFWTASAITVIGLGIGTYYGVQALSLSDDAKKRAEDEVDASENTPEGKEETDDAALKADVFFAVTGVMALGSGLLFFLTDWDDTLAGEKKRRASFNLQLADGRASFYLKGFY
ncbi:MAG: PEGA domain-containing protein [Deltaproteobacteria bacterium]|nr:PEGA domain-containing protein [Deltaproteobacteria bacterium]